MAKPQYSIDNFSGGVNEEDLWGHSVGSVPVLDRFVYKGKGRPKKTDYITVKQLERKINKELSDYIDKQA